MSGHLTNEQWEGIVLHQNDASAQEHLAGCATCRGEVNAFLAAASAAQAHQRKAMEQPEAFWQRQREHILARVANRDFAHPWRRWIWVTATVMLVLLASTLLTRHTTPHLQPAPPSDPDDALMLSVQQSIHSDLPQALRPAALLTQEMDRVGNTRRNP